MLPDESLQIKTKQIIYVDRKEEYMMSILVVIIIALLVRLEQITRSF